MQSVFRIIRGGENLVNFLLWSSFSFVGKIDYLSNAIRTFNKIWFKDALNPSGSLQGLIPVMENLEIMGMINIFKTLKMIAVHNNTLTLKKISWGSAFDKQSPHMSHQLAGKCHAES